jgi:nucleoside 2-deoxyribosyltransferase
MNRLKGATAYLAGSVDHSEDPRKWRREIARDLLIPLGVGVYDPLIKPSWMCDYAKTSPGRYRDILNNPEHLLQNDIWEGMAEVRKVDLRLAHSCDFMIVHLPKQFTVGTMEEISVAAAAGKPILVHAPDGCDISTWLPVQLASSPGEYRENHLFTNWFDLYSYIRGVDNGSLKVDNYKWIFITYSEDMDVRNTYESDFEQIRT